MIVAAGRDLADVAAWIATDPFVVGGAAEYSITGFSATPFPERSAAFDFSAATTVGA